MDIARRDLLDLGLRNPLLNYRPLKARGVEVAFGDPAEAFRILVNDEKKMTFLAGESSTESGADLAAQHEPGEPSEHHPSDPRLRTQYTPIQLQSRLLSTYHAARTSIEEQGVNTLYLASGMLRWFEDDQSDKAHKAPLILIPVELERNDARDRFHLSYNGEDLVANVSLAEKLKVEFGFRRFPDLPDSDELDVEGYFREVKKLVSGQKRWDVEPDVIALGFFSFAKLLMYRDLDPGTWKNSDKHNALLDHEILQRLMGDAGFAPQPSNYDESQLLDDQLQGRNPIQIVDADSSQTLAVLDAMDGRNMVIQGPPGTGKSQTIVNLISAAVAEGKKVLFVAEKMAALDVVKRRLDAVGLGSPCLVMHGTGSDKARSIKRKVIDDLRSTVQCVPAKAPRNAGEAEQLADARQKLNSYCTAVNTPIGETGETPCSAYGKLLDAQEQLKDLELPLLPGRFDASGWSLIECRQRQQLIAQLQDRLTRCGVPNEHAFWGSKLTVLLPSDKDSIIGALRAALQASVVLQAASASLAGLCGMPTPEDSAAARLLAETADFAGTAPELTEVETQSATWLQKEEEISATLRAGQEYQSLRREYADNVKQDAWTHDVEVVSLAVVELGSRWWRLLSPRWRRAKAEVASLCIGKPPKTPAAMLELLNGVSGASRCAKLIVSSASMMEPLFGPSWKGTESAWDWLERQATWCIEAQKGVGAGRLASWCITSGTRYSDKALLVAATGELRNTIGQFDRAVENWCGVLKIGAAVEGPPSMGNFNTLQHTWSLQVANLGQLQSLVGFNQIASEVAKAGLESVVAISETWSCGPQKLVPWFERGRLSSVLERAFRERPALAGFDGADHQRTVQEFRRLDRLDLEINRVVLAAQCAKAMPTNGGSGALGVLWREFEKKRKHLPIRQLMESAGHAVQSIKPVFMMSPLSIANFVPPGCLTFDLVIFDEASQVRPVDALGAVVRGKQVVVVGDSKQLPPTSFFDSLATQEEAEDDEGDQPATSDIESILGLFSARGAQQRMLRWHYRSRHESLIAVSNHLFYGDGLVVFPSPSLERKTVGLVYRRLQNAFYDRSRTRTNPDEAKAVAAAVMEHAREQLRLPQSARDTLGVAAFSVAQMDAIRAQIELLRKQDPSCEGFFGYPPHEPFFVKNLENVQGDERDVIFISIGYGRTAEGFLAMNFGPLNRDGGERRMNVLISRARKRCEVFTSLAAEDIDLSRGAGAGIAALKTFLQYAETGKLETSAATGRPPDSDFEEQVMRKLTALGHTIQPQVGCAGFFLDLGVVDPVHPGRYLLGIECDGARYHSARSARDRDRLRQCVLEGLGWRIHRIWSTDWFRDPEGELRKVVREIEASQESGPVVAPEPVSTRQAIPDEVELPALVPEMRSQSSKNQPHFYESARVGSFAGTLQLHEIDRRTLARQFSIVVAVEGPVHWREAARRIVAGAGVQRMGNRIEAAFLEAIQVAVSTKLLAQKGEFLWTPEMHEPIVRDRSHLPAASRKLELVAPEEIQKAVLVVISESYGMPAADVPVAVCRRLGFAQTTDDMRRLMERNCDELRSRGQLRASGVNLTVAGPD